MRLRDIYLELLELFANRWKVDEMQVEGTGTTETQSATVSGVAVRFAIDYDANTITMHYWDPWYEE